MLKKGYSLLETAIVLAIIIILVTTTIQKQPFLTELLLRNELETLFVTFTFLQKKAIASHTKRILTINVKKNHYAYNIKNKILKQTLPKQIKFGYIPYSKGPPSKPQNLITQCISFKPHKKNVYYVEFFANGNITPGTLYITDQTESHMKALTCPVAHVSYIRKYTYKNKKWDLFS